MDKQKNEKLLALLEANKTWPMLYMFKFIVPNADDKVKQVAGMMPKGGEITYKNTKNLKYVSVTCKVSMPSAESIVDIHEQVGAVEGVMSL